MADKVRDGDAERVIIESPAIARARNEPRRLPRRVGQDVGKECFGDVRARAGADRPRQPACQPSRRPARTLERYCSSSDAGFPRLSSSVSSPGTLKNSGLSIGCPILLTCRCGACPCSVIRVQMDSAPLPSHVVWDLEHDRADVAAIEDVAVPIEDFRFVASRPRSRRGIRPRRRRPPRTDLRPHRPTPIRSPRRHRIGSTSFGPPASDLGPTHRWRHRRSLSEPVALGSRLLPGLREQHTQTQAFPSPIAPRR